METNIKASTNKVSHRAKESINGVAVGIIKESLKRAGDREMGYGLIMIVFGIRDNLNRIAKMVKAHKYFHQARNLKGYLKMVRDLLEPITIIKISKFLPYLNE